MIGDEQSHSVKLDIISAEPPVMEAGGARLAEGGTAYPGIGATCIAEGGR